MTVDLPDPESGDVGVDVLWLVDLSGSFGDDIATWQNNTSAIVNALKTKISDLRVGLASFVDAPCGDFGSYLSGDYGYKLEVPLTSNFTQFSERIGNLTIYSGSDTPESQLEAMYQAITGEGVVCNGTCANATINATDPGWGAGRIHLLVVSTDAPFHRPTDVDWSGIQYPYPANVTDVLAAANETGVSISFLFAGYDYDWDGNTTVTDIYQIEPATGEIANATHGIVYTMSANSSEIVEALESLANATVGNATIELVPVGDTYGIVASISPSVLTGIDLTSTDKVDFTVTFSAPSGTTLPSSIDFYLVVKVEGSEIYRIPVHVVIS
ncbi:hypothetical protein [Desulfurobacterium sp.]